MNSVTYEEMSDVTRLERAEALDSIDALRQTPFSIEIDAPQIVVCGSNLIDKNFFLDEITQLPKTARLWKPYPTEYILRYDVGTRVNASFRPDPSRVVADTLHLQRFRYTLWTTERSEISRMFAAASLHYRQLYSTSRYYHDMLQIEVAGPTQLPLTLIDLPTLDTTRDHDQSLENMEFALKLAHSYMYKPRTIILAIVDPTQDGRLPLIRDIVSSELAIHCRTLGVMMKPVHMPESAVQKLYQVARNEDTELRLGFGWHMIRPTLYSEPENKTDIWSAPPPANNGVQSLRKKLSDMLFSSIQREMPRLLVEMTLRMIQAVEGNGEPC